MLDHFRMRKNFKREFAAKLLETTYVESVHHVGPHGYRYFRLTISGDDSQLLRTFQEIVGDGCVFLERDGRCRWTLQGRRAWKAYEDHRELLSPEKRKEIESVASACDPKPWEPSRAGRPRKVAA